MPGVRKALVAESSRGPARFAELEPSWAVDIGDFPTDLAWSPDGERLAVASAAGPVVVLGADGEEQLRYPGHELGSLAVDWSPQGERLASGGQDGRVRVWTPDASSPQAELRGGAAWVELLAWSKDGGRLATGSGKFLKVWDASDWSEIGSFDHPNTISGLAWRGESGRLVTSSYGGVQFWELGQPTAHRRFRWKGSSICMRVSPNGRWIICGSQDCSVHIWKSASGQDLEMSGYPLKVKQLGWSDDSRYLATGGGAEVCIWDFSGQGPAGTRPEVRQGHVDAIADVAFQPGSHLLASLGRDGSLCFWNGDKGRSKKALASGGRPSSGSKLAWSPNGASVATAFESGEVVAWKAPSVS